MDSLSHQAALRKEVYMYIDHMTAQHIVDQLSKGLQTDCCVTDCAYQVLASTSTELAIFQIPKTNDEIPHGHLVIPLHAGTEEVGQLIVTATPDQSKDTMQMVKTLAELIIRQRATFEQMFDRQWVIDKFVCDLLHGHFQGNEEMALEDAMVMEIDLDVPRVVVVIDTLLIARCTPATSSYNEPLTANPERSLRSRRRHLIDMAQRYLGSSHNHIYSFFDEHRFVILAAIDVAAAEGTDREDAQQQLKQSIQALAATLAQGANGSVSAGIGGYYPGWASLACSYQDARFALEAGRTLLGGGHVYFACELGLATFVCAQNNVTKSELADRLLGPLLDKPELLETLEIFLEADLSSGAAAERLHMHRHGLTYRLKKIQELTGLDPTIFGDAIQLTAALQWHRVFQTLPPSPQHKSAQF